MQLIHIYNNLIIFGDNPTILKVAQSISNDNSINIQRKLNQYSMEYINIQ